MNRDTILRLAREAGAIPASDGEYWPHELILSEAEFEHFATLVAAHERELNAQLCDEMVLYTGYDCAAAIRARKETDQ